MVPDTTMTGTEEVSPMMAAAGRDVTMSDATRKFLWGLRLELVLWALLLRCLV